MSHSNRSVTRASLPETPPGGAPPEVHFLSREAVLAIAHMIASFAHGGGTTDLNIDSGWSGTVAWARNQLHTAEDTFQDFVRVERTIRGAKTSVFTDQLDDRALEYAVRRAERLLLRFDEDQSPPVAPPTAEPLEVPKLWVDRTAQLDAAARAAVARATVQRATDAGTVAAGVLVVTACTRAQTLTSAGMVGYVPYTQAQYSVTVRDPQGIASGWAGMDHHDWAKIDVDKLAAIALRKCLDSRNPVAIEPGRYTTILEPQAVGDFVAPLVGYRNLDRKMAETNEGHPFAGAQPGELKIGQRVIDERLSISADPTDPDCGFAPFGLYGDVYHPVTWIEHGVLKQLAYDRAYAVRRLGRDTSLGNRHALHMSGGTTSVEEMIATTTRGLLVTRFSNVEEVAPGDDSSIMLTGYTRDGVWLIERGKITKPVKNFRFTESLLLALNNVVEVGVPQRVFSPEAPWMVPPLKIRDFSFTKLTNAV